MRGSEACLRGSSLRLNGYDGPFEVGHLDREQFVARRFGDGGEPVRVFLLDLLEKVQDDACVPEMLARFSHRPRITSSIPERAASVGRYSEAATPLLPRPRAPG